MDRCAAFVEATRPAGISEREAVKVFTWPRGFRSLELESLALAPVSPPDAKRAFLTRFDGIQARV